MIKEIDLGDGILIRMKASAMIPRLYRFKFGRDMIRDMSSLNKAFKKLESLPETATEEEREEAQLSVLDLTIFENCAYIMAKHADASIPNSPEEWLDTLNTFSIYQVLPQILELWAWNNKTTAIPKKK